MAVNATAEEEAIIKKRYLTQTAATGAQALPPFKKLTKRYLEFCQAVEGGTAEEAERLYGDLLADLYAVQFHMQKLHEVSDAFRREQAMYSESQEQLQASIAQAAVDIEERKRQLEQARLELKQKQEYEVLKRQVVEVPARSATRAEMQAVEREIADMQAQAQQLDALFERRKQQFAAVAACVEEVHTTIEAETPPEEGALPGEPGEAPPAPALAGAAQAAATVAGGGKAAAGALPPRPGQQAGGGPAPMQIG